MITEKPKCTSTTDEGKIRCTRPEGHEGHHEAVTPGVCPVTWAPKMARWHKADCVQCGNTFYASRTMECDTTKTYMCEGCEVWERATADQKDLEEKLQKAEKRIKLLETDVNTFERVYIKLRSILDVGGSVEDLPEILERRLKSYREKEEARYKELQDHKATIRVLVRNDTVVNALYTAIDQTKEHPTWEDYWKLYSEFGAATSKNMQTIQRLEAEIERWKQTINTPMIKTFLEAVPREAAHQIERWGVKHDAGKTPEDWYWLLGYLSGKVLRALNAGDENKALHHVVSSAAVLLNWFRALTGETKDMRPGIAPPAGEPAELYIRPVDEQVAKDLLGGQQEEESKPASD